VLLAIYGLVLVTQGFINVVASKGLDSLYSFSVWFHVIFVTVFVVVLPSVVPQRQSAEYVFTRFVPANEAGIASGGFLFLLGLLGSQWAMVRGRAGRAAARRAAIVLMQVAPAPAMCSSWQPSILRRLATTRLRTCPRRPSALSWQVGASGCRCICCALALQARPGLRQPAAWPARDGALSWRQPADHPARPPYLLQAPCRC
jgi:hypothetical protein